MIIDHFLSFQIKIKKEIRTMTAKFNENIIVAIFLLSLFIIELFLRKNKGLL